MSRTQKYTTNNSNGVTRKQHGGIGTNNPLMNRTLIFNLYFLKDGLFLDKPELSKAAKDKWTNKKIQKPKSARQIKTNTKNAERQILNVFNDFILESKSKELSELNNDVPNYYTTPPSNNSNNQKLKLTLYFLEDGLFMDKPELSTIKTKFTIPKSARKIEKKDQLVEVINEFLTKSDLEVLKGNVSEFYDENEIKQADRGNRSLHYLGESKDAAKRLDELNVQVNKIYKLFADNNTSTNIKINTPTEEEIRAESKFTSDDEKVMELEKLNGNEDPDYNYKNNTYGNYTRYLQHDVVGFAQGYDDSNGIPVAKSQKIRDLTLLQIKNLTKNNRYCFN